MIPTTAIKIDKYESRNNVYQLQNIYYDYVHLLIYQYDPIKNVFKVIKPKRKHFIVWQKSAIFLSVHKLDEIVIKMFNEEHIMELRKKNPNAIILTEQNARTFN